MSDSHDHAEAKKDADSVDSNDSSSDVESKLLGLDDVTGVPSDNAEDARDGSPSKGGGGR